MSHEFPVWILCSLVISRMIVFLEYYRPENRPNVLALEVGKYIFKVMNKTCPHLHLLNTPENLWFNLWFSGVFRDVK